MKARYLRLFTPTAKQQKIVLYCVEKLCQMDAEAVKVVADMLNGFWEEARFLHSSPSSHSPLVSLSFPFSLLLPFLPFPPSPSSPPFPPHA